MAHRQIIGKETIKSGFYRLPDTDRGSATFSADSSKLLADWRTNEEGVLIIVPHDDDATIGMGMLLQHLTRAKIPLTIAVVTDGRLGYTSEQDRASISQIRMREMNESCRILGIDESQIQWLGFPDGDLERYRGKRVAVKGDPISGDGFTGLEDAFVRVIRRGVDHHGKRYPITRIFCPAASDYHNDHVVVSEQIMISIFHAQGLIWPECGACIGRRPFCYQFAIYCDFAADQPPNLLYQGNSEYFEAKMRSIMSFKSQGQIAALVEQLRSEGPTELYREVEFRLASRDRQLAPFLNRKYTVVD
jgi:LmbE family N-acetylglucosaminyl deacetylase